MAASKSANFFSYFSLIAASWSSYDLTVFALDTFSSSICFRNLDSNSSLSFSNLAVISSLSSLVFDLCFFSNSAISCLSVSRAFWCDSLRPLTSLSISSAFASNSSWRLVIFSSYSVITVLWDSTKLFLSLKNVSSISLFSLLHFSVISSLTALICFSWPCFKTKISCSIFSVFALLVSSSLSISFSIWAIFTSYSCWVLVNFVS